MIEPSPTIRVKRDGPRGWHNIAASSFDPKVHERYGENPAQAPVAAPVMDEPQINRGEPTPIPDDWQSLHWKKQVELAEAIVGGRDRLVSADGKTLAEKARSIIMAEWSDR